MEISYGELLKQATMTATEYFDTGTRVIDERFGENYARDHPDLLAAFMSAAATDYGFAALSKTIDDALAGLGDRLGAK